MIEIVKWRRFGVCSVFLFNFGFIVEYILELDYWIYGLMVRYVRDFLCFGDFVLFMLVEMWLVEMFFDFGIKYFICFVFVGLEIGGKMLFFEVLWDYVLGEVLMYFVDFIGELGYFFRSFFGWLFVVGMCKMIDRFRCLG